MADSSFAPPTGPPPPKVPEGWKAVWNDQYKEWFFVNIYTKVSQWDKPTEPVYPPNESGPVGPPPSYETKPGYNASEKVGLASNNPYASTGATPTPSHDMSADEKLARKLQEEENARSGSARPTDGSRGAADSYYNQAGQPPQYGQQQQQYGGGYGQPSYGQTPNPWEQQQQQQQHYPQQQYQQQQYVAESDKGKGKSGLLGKILGKASAHKQSSHMGGGAPMMMGRGAPYGYPQQAYYQAPPGRRPGGPGMGAMAGGAALGVGAGMLGGAMLGSAIAGDGGDGGDYGGDGGDYGGDYGGDGGDFGGGDFGGGDFGGDF